MSYSTTITKSSTFTVSHARHISARIKTDLRRLTRYYPTNLTEQRIEDFHTEITEFLRKGYLKSVTYGFKTEEDNLLGGSTSRWVLALKYEVINGELDGGSDSPGGILPGKDVSGTHFHSFLSYNSDYTELSESEKLEFEFSLPIKRTSGYEPTGNWSYDRAYGQGGRYVNRTTTYPM